MRGRTARHHIGIEIEAVFAGALAQERANGGQQRIGIMLDRQRIGVEPVIGAQEELERPARHHVFDAQRDDRDVLVGGAFDLARHHRGFIAVPGEDENDDTRLVDGGENHLAPAGARPVIAVRDPAADGVALQCRANGIGGAFVLTGIADEDAVDHHAKEQYVVAAPIEITCGATTLQRRIKSRTFNAGNPAALQSLSRPRSRCAGERLRHGRVKRFGVHFQVGELFLRNHHGLGDAGDLPQFCGEALGVLFPAVGQRKQARGQIARLRHGRRRDQPDERDHRRHHKNRGVAAVLMGPAADHAAGKDAEELQARVKAHGRALGVRRRRLGDERRQARFHDVEGGEEDNERRRHDGETAGAAIEQRLAADQRGHRADEHALHAAIFLGDDDRRHHHGDGNERAPADRSSIAPGPARRTSSATGRARPKNSPSAWHAARICRSRAATAAGRAAPRRSMPAPPRRRGARSGVAASARRAR